MRNRIEQYHEIKKAKFNEAIDKRSAQDLARADDDGFANSANNSQSPSDQGSDCWSDLWQQIKDKGSKFFRQKN